ncbi:MAG: hypothetical protein ACR2N3_09015 [Pyrinomonadaceae bacterium]
MPWEGKFLESGVPNSENKTHYQVYCGIYEIRTVRDKLIEKLGKDPEAFDKRFDGTTFFRFCVGKIIIHKEILKKNLPCFDLIQTTSK